MISISQSVLQLLLLRCGCLISGLLLFQQAAVAFNPANPYGYWRCDQIAAIEDHLMALRLNEATFQLFQYRQREPGNLLAVYLEHYADFIYAMVTSDGDALARLRVTSDERRNLIAKGPQSSPYRGFLMAEISLHQAGLHFYGEGYIRGFMGMRRAYREFEANRDKFPDFVANRKSIGLMQIMVTAIPGRYARGASFVSGIPADAAAGRRMMLQVVEHHRPFNDFIYKEASILYSFLLLQLDGNRQQAYEFAKAQKWNTRDALMPCFVLANLAIYNGKNDEALNLLTNRPRGPQYLSIPYIHYMYGETLLRAGRYAQAKDAFLAFVREEKGEDYKKDALQKAAWSMLLSDNMPEYRRLMNLVKQTGIAQSNGDKAAQREAVSGPVPHRELLTAGLQFDGGYYRQALSTLTAIPQTELNTDARLAEFHYLKARTLDRLNRTDEASKHYSEAISRGSSIPEHFACAAALRFGQMLEKAGDKERARVAFETSLRLKPDLYADVLHRQARSGLSRLN